MFLNLEKFQHTLPYASELYGVYQPLIGWKSRLITNRLATNPKQLPQFPKEVIFPIQSPRDPNFDDITGTIESLLQKDLFTQDPTTIKWTFPSHLDSLILRQLEEELSQLIVQHDKEDAAFWEAYWAAALSADRIVDYHRMGLEFTAVYTQHTITHQEDQLAPTPMKAYLNGLALALNIRSDFKTFLEYVVNRELYVARYLEITAREKPDTLTQLILGPVTFPTLNEQLKRLDPNYLMPANFGDAVLSPIGILHRYRQYFFEFDTFLGSPVEHIWLSPGSTLELIETSSRKVTIERTVEQSLASVLRSESSSTEQDELSSAIKNENQQDVKMGSALEGGVNVLIFNVQASGSLEKSETERNSREQTHRTMRQQSSKLSSEIRQNYKSTFKISTETTDTRSKRYVIENPKNKLVNYELRRKMRQVGVQMQALGSSLCWQVYVDDPGQQLGVAELVHLAAKADLTQYPNLQTLPIPQPFLDVVNINLVVPNPGDRSNLHGEIASGVVGFVAGGVPGAVVGVAVHEIVEDLFGGGKESSGVYGIEAVNTIRQLYKYSLPAGYQLTLIADSPNRDFNDNDVAAGFDKNEGDIPVRWLHKNGIGVQSRAEIHNNSEGIIELIVDRGEVTAGEIIDFQVKVKMTPTPAHLAVITEKNTAIATQNGQNELERDRLVKEAFVKSMKERIDFSSRIKSRKAEDLREEERTVIYRKLIQALMRDAWNVNTSRPSRSLAHLRSELIKAIFDVDKMLYYVAPEWWQPRLHHSKQDLGMDQELFDLQATKINSVSRKLLQQAQIKTAVSTAQKEQKQNLGTLDGKDTVSRGGKGRADNYFITETSDPAKLGSSLGWLLQLDGDNLRNAFLNAPWVKAVIPIRQGREKEAFQWLMESQVEGVEGLDAMYDDQRTVRQALDDLVFEIMTEHEKAKAMHTQDVQINENEQQPVYFLAQDEVFEKGFDPLAGGFRATPDKDKPFAVFDQWVEILPTDQIVAVAVEYDPKTGRLKG